AGLDLMVGKNSPFHCLSQTTDPAGRFIIVHGRWGSRLVTFASMYAPNIDDPMMVQNFFLKLAQYPSPWVIGGDFNCPIDTVVDRSSSILVAQTQMARVIQASMVVSSSLIRQVKDCNFLPRYISDHSPVSIRVEALEDVRGPYRWRLDPQLLTKEESVGEIESAIQEFFHFNHPSVSPPDMIWEAFKVTIRGKIIALSSAYRKAFQQRMVGLEQDLRGAETELYKNNSAENRERVASLQHDLNVLSTSKAERALLKTRSRFYARGDKAGKLLAWQLCREETDRHVPSIKLSDSTTSCVPGAINGTFQNYYASLYSTQYDEGTTRGPMLSFLDGV
uniref:Endonuclease/exonuclease/phosphatase domain-containing protein n=1 Tax=Latimeria chalumnae TaxID=7897 RepID=H3AE61_LATCH